MSSRLFHTIVLASTAALAGGTTSCSARSASATAPDAQVIAPILDDIDGGSREPELDAGYDGADAAWVDAEIDADADDDAGDAPDTDVDAGWAPTK